MARRLSEHEQQGLEGYEQAFGMVSSAEFALRQAGVEVAGMEGVDAVVAMFVAQQFVSSEQEMMRMLNNNAYSPPALAAERLMLVYEATGWHAAVMFAIDPAEMRDFPLSATPAIQDGQYYLPTTQMASVAAQMIHDPDNADVIGLKEVSSWVDDAIASLQLIPGLDPMPWEAIALAAGLPVLPENC